VSILTNATQGVAISIGGKRTPALRGGVLRKDRAVCLRDSLRYTRRCGSARTVQCADIVTLPVRAVMRIAHRLLDVAVSEPPADTLDRHAVLRQARREAVPQIMPGETVDLRLRQHLAIRLDFAAYLAERVAEYQNRLRWAAAGLRLPCHENFDDFLADRHITRAVALAGRLEYSLNP
jgi:hypothetical protein